MARFPFIAAIATLVTVAAVPLSASADTYGHRGYRGPDAGYGRHVVPAPRVWAPPRPHFDRFHARRDWHPRPRWNRWNHWSYWR